MKIAMQLNSAVLPYLSAPQSIAIPDMAAGSSGLVEEDSFDSGNSGSLHDLDVESLMLNLDASLRVYQREHFFSWTQGLLQSVIRHEVMVCALRNPDPQSMRAESFSMVAPDPAIFGEMFLRDASVAPGLIKAWEDRQFRPLICDVADSPFAKGLFARELERVGATQILANGTHDAEGRVSSFFVFACLPGMLGDKQAYIARLVTPFVHSAWVRTEVNWRTKCNDVGITQKARKITTREQEILKWVYLGKSNFEIGSILDISPLTVKNHVQKILRKLDVVNRAQAVGKAMDLRILRT